MSLPVALDLLRSLRFCFAGFCSRSAHGRCCSAAARACFPGLYLHPVALGPLFAFCLPSFKWALLTFISVLWLWIGAWLPLLCRCACLLVFVHVRFAGLCLLWKYLDLCSYLRAICRDNKCSRKKFWLLWHFF